MANDYVGLATNFAFVAQKSYKTALERQVSEAILIDEAEPTSLLNSRSEWGQNKVPRIKIKRDDFDQSQGQGHNGQDGRHKPGQDQPNISVQDHELNPRKKRRQNEDNLRQLSPTTLVKFSSDNVMPYRNQGQSSCISANNVKHTDGYQNVNSSRNTKRNRNDFECNGIVMDTTLGSSFDKIDGSTSV